MLLREIAGTTERQHDPGVGDVLIDQAMIDQQIIGGNATLDMQLTDVVLPYAIAKRESATGIAIEGDRLAKVVVKVATLDGEVLRSGDLSVDVECIAGAVVDVQIGEMHAIAIVGEDAGAVLFGVVVGLVAVDRQVANRDVGDV